MNLAGKYVVVWQWVSAYSSADRLPVGEVGTLEGAQLISDRMLLLTITYDGQRTPGLLPVPRTMAAAILAVLRSYRGRPLTEVAMVDIPSPPT